MIIDCIADLHGHYPQLEGGDLMIVAGDLTAHDTANDWCEFETWIYKQPYENKLIIAGNHDNFLMSFDEHTMWRFWDKLGVTYLCDSGTELVHDELTPPSSGMNCLDTLFYETKRLKIWGSPWTKRFEGMNPKCMAFTVDTDEELAEKWALIPDDVDILVTHSPSFGNFDIVKDYYTGNMPSVGSVSLWMRCLQIKPKLHICGHIHESYGQAKHTNGIHLVNASHVNEHYEPVNKPVRIEL